MALAEQFAGMYAQAIAHNREALAIAEEIGDTDEAALLDANLCLTLRQAGELEAAKAIKFQQILGNKRIEGQARNRAGHTLSALGRWADAYHAYGEALVVWESLQHPNRNEALAGRAAAGFHLGKQEEALALVEEVLDFVARKGLPGIVEPVRLLLNCETVLGGVEQVERARQVLLQAEQWIEMIAGRISDETMRAAFLHNRPDNQLLKTRIASYQQAPL
jgi:tetratricopeptide (TPR) repeat protein